MQRNTAKTKLRSVENKSIKGADGKKLAKAKDGKVDFSKGKAKKLAESELFDSSGNPTPNFEQLKQIVADYPQSITTLPDGVIKTLNRQTVYVKQKNHAMYDSHGRITGWTYTNKAVSGFDYMQGVAAAGIKLAEEQGRTAQSSPAAKASFEAWRNAKVSMLGATAARIHTNANASTKSGEFIIG